MDSLDASMKETGFGEWCQQVKRQIQPLELPTEGALYEMWLDYRWTVRKASEVIKVDAEKKPPPPEAEQ